MSYADKKDNVREAARSARDEASSRVSQAAETVKNEAGEMHDSLARGASELVDNVSSKLKTVGVDTDVMVNAARDQASELQRLIGEELRARPMRALGVAAVVGLFVGLMTARS